MIAIEEKIEQFYKETEQSVETIIEGSDEHLDLILSIVNPLNSISKKFESFNEFMFQEADTYTDEQLRDIVMPRLRSLNRSCLILIGAISRSNLYSSVREAFKKYRKQHDLLIEFMHDAHTVRLAKDDEFDNLMKELNDL